MNETKQDYSLDNYKKFRNLCGEYLIDVDHENCYNLGLAYGLSYVFYLIKTMNGEASAFEWFAKTLEINKDNKFLIERFRELILDYI